MLFPLKATSLCRLRVLCVFSSDQREDHGTCAQGFPSFFIVIRFIRLSGRCLHLKLLAVSHCVNRAGVALSES